MRNSTRWSRSSTLPLKVTSLLSLLLVPLPPVVASQKVDIFSSMRELSKLVRKEKDFVDGLVKLAGQLEESAASIRRYLKFNEAYVGTEESYEEYVGNPVNSLNLIKRLSVELAKYDILSLLENNATAVLQQQLHNSTKELPDVKDWTGACNGIHLLQEHYRLNISQLSNGIIQFKDKTFVSEHILDVDEMTIIGILANNDGYHDAGIDWLLLAQQKYHGLKNSGKRFAEDATNIDKRVVDGKKIHDHILDHRGVIGPGHRCNYLPFDSKLRKKKKYREARRSNKTERAEKLRQMYPLYKMEAVVGKHTLRDNFEQICKGEQLRTPDMDTDIKCRLLHHHDPYLLLGPFQLEELSFEPYITVIHHLMHETEVEHFKNFASDRLARSETGGGMVAAVSLKRTSKQTWLEHRNFQPDQQLVHAKIGAANINDSLEILRTDYSWGSHFCQKQFSNSTDTVAEKVSTRIELATKFHLHRYYSAEPFQIANYGLGGQYSEHMDPHGYWDGVAQTEQHHLSGDRLATIMVYLADVEAGGATSYPNTGVHIPARRGDGAFWINMFTSGLQDKLTNHGGCPVLVGSKWITNKWVGYKDQFRQYPCDVTGSHTRYQKFTAYY